MMGSWGSVSWGSGKGGGGTEWGCEPFLGVWYVFSGLSEYLLVSVL